MVKNVEDVRIVITHGGDMSLVGTRPPNADEWCLREDIRILFKTVGAVFGDEGAM